MDFLKRNKNAVIFTGIGLAIIIVVIILVAAGGPKIEYDYSIKMLGYVRINNQDSLESYYENLLGIENAQFTELKIGNFDSGEGHQGMWYLFDELNDAEVDLFILNEDLAAVLAEEGALEDMSDYINSLGISTKSDSLVWYEDETVGKIIIGVKYSGFSLFSENIDGEIPGCISLPDGAEWTKETEMVIIDLMK